MSPRPRRAFVAADPSAAGHGPPERDGRDPRDEAEREVRRQRAPRAALGQAI